MTGEPRNPDAIGTPVGFGDLVWTRQRWDDWQSARRTIEQHGIELVRVVLVDAHGVLRGKALTPDALESAMRHGHGLPGTVLLKDTANRTVYPVFDSDEVLGDPRLTGIGDLVLLPDPATFHVLAHAPGTAVVLADVHYPDGEPVAISPRAILARQVDRLAEQGLAARIGAELEFHVFRDVRDRLDPADAGMPGRPRDVELLTPGYQLLADTALDDFHPVVDLVRETARTLDLPLRSVEAEMGPSQLEVTFAPLDAMAAADGVALFRSSLRQAAHRAGLHVTFMTRPALPNVFSAGCHVHLSLVDADGANVFAPSGPASDEARATTTDDVLSETGRAWLAGLLAHAPAATALTTPTINGYKRYRPHSLAPERIGWGVDNKGAMLRVVGQGPATRIENRAGEAAANPHLLLAAQLACGRHGLVEGLAPPAATTTPYAEGERLPATLRDALDALASDAVLEEALGTTVRRWFLDLKRHEVARHEAHVGDWEHHEYFELF